MKPKKSEWVYGKSQKKYKKIVHKCESPHTIVKRNGMKINLHKAVCSFYTQVMMYSESIVLIW